MDDWRSHERLEYLSRLDPHICSAEFSSFDSLPWAESRNDLLSSMEQQMKHWKTLIVAIVVSVPGVLAECGRDPGPLH